MPIAVVVGNPKPASRTLDAAVRVATRVSDRAPDHVIDLAAMGEDETAAAVSAVQKATHLVVACPTYKASFTGILKVFLDRFPADALAGTVAFPVMLGGAWNHSLAPEIFLKPVLVEMGARCPVRGLYLLDSDYIDPPGLAEWIEVARAEL